MCSAKELIRDGVRYLINFMFEPEPTSREGVVFRESFYLSKIHYQRQVQPGTYLKMDEEKLRYQLPLVNGEIRLWVESSITGDCIYSWYIVKLSHNTGVLTVVEQGELMLNDISE